MAQVQPNHQDQFEAYLQDIQARIVNNTTRPYVCLVGSYEEAHELRERLKAGQNKPTPVEHQQDLPANNYQRTQYVRLIWDAVFTLVNVLDSPGSLQIRNVASSGDNKVWSDDEVTVVCWNILEHVELAAKGINTLDTFASSEKIHIKSFTSFRDRLTQTLEMLAKSKSAVQSSVSNDEFRSRGAQNPVKEHSRKRTNKNLNDNKKLQITYAKQHKRAAQEAAQRQGPGVAAQAEDADLQVGLAQPQADGHSNNNTPQPTAGSKRGRPASSNSQPAKKRRTSKKSNSTSSQAQATAPAPAPAPAAQVAALAPGGIRTNTNEARLSPPEPSNGMAAVANPGPAASFGALLPANDFNINAVHSMQQNRPSLMPTKPQNYPMSREKSPWAEQSYHEDSPAVSQDQQCIDPALMQFQTQTVNPNWTPQELIAMGHGSQAVNANSQQDPDWRAYVSTRAWATNGPGSRFNSAASLSQPPAAPATTVPSGQASYGAQMYDPVNNMLANNMVANNGNFDNVNNFDNANNWLADNGLANNGNYDNGNNVLANAVPANNVNYNHVNYGHVNNEPANNVLANNVPLGMSPPSTGRSGQANNVVQMDQPIAVVPMDLTAPSAGLSGLGDEPLFDDSEFFNFGLDNNDVFAPPADEDADEDAEGELDSEYPVEGLQGRQG
ncbi:hypothetical protein F4808DRAFT_473068 [Astrocystis sublimbata]|nr:hypothetical protein F4808DRAFT_473068 [Astrocystis sublimbata]